MNLRLIFWKVLNCPFYKVASFEMNHIPLIKKIAQTGKPIIISTGMANLKEIDLAYKTAKNNGAKEIILLYCVSNYPCKDFGF
jgi:sialic acid synthase SpsE